ncbi:MAG TPA: hypothetical protein PLW14_08935 [Chlorobiota bacterium]|nr:hypothetical protein [Chlorobiota bacterium]
MKHIRSISLSLGFVALMVLTACSRQAEAPPIDGFTLHEDRDRGFAMKFPANWKVQKFPGEVIVAYGLPAMSGRFSSFGKGEGGVKIELRSVKLDSTLTMDTLIKNSQVQFEDGLQERYKISTATVGGKSGKKLAVNFDQEDGNFRSEAYFAEQDSLVTIVTFAAFGGTFESYESEFAEMLASVRLAKRPEPAAPKVDTSAPRGPEPPSDTLRSYTGSEFSIQIPNNFESKKAKQAGTLSSVNFFGSRLDCSIQVDVLDASKQNNLDKILEQNKATYQGGKATMTTLGGQKAGYFSYNPNNNVSSRAYFVVKGNKLFRVTMNWYKPEQSVYLPIFEKCLATMKFQ